MFPYSYNLPSLLFKFSADLFVSFFIFFYLFLPEVFVGSGLNKMSGASVPETSVHKHNGFVSGKDNIWFAVKSAAKSITKTSFPQQAPEVFFRNCIAASDFGHIVASLS